MQNERLLVPKVVYGDFPCQSGGDLIVYDDTRAERVRFFPATASRQAFVRPTFSPHRSGRLDVVASL